ncbi:hypothetical protein [Marmoricola sp. RAF53]|uniref:hypothetical protein n=1 Tax=Marmoricola sp. RAF53 TaxID=3233059 RepID=UPI003F9BBBBA
MRTRTRRRLIAPALAAAAVLLVGSGCSHDSSVTPPTSAASASDARVEQARSAVRTLSRALADRDAGAAAGTGVAGSRQVLEAAAANVGVLGLTDVALRLVDDDSSADPEALQSFGPDSWEGTVEVRYRIPGWDTETTRVETPFVFVPGEHGQQVAAIGGADGRTPLWLTGPVVTRPGDRTLVISRTGSAARYAPMLQRALADVARVLPDWNGRLVLEVPGSEEALDQALDASQDQYANIAAVTSSVDGSLVPGAPVHVFLNPRVFDGLGPRGAQVVVSHESTHVATGATFSDMPTWLLEGFADYVALAHARIPVATAASQILASVRRDGPPDHLPTPTELAPTAAGLGATYEEAWLANRFIAREHGERKLVAFYDAVNAGKPVAQAFASVLGTTEAAFVKRWRADLATLAGGEAG